MPFRSFLIILKKEGFFFGSFIFIYLFWAKYFLPTSPVVQIQHQLVDNDLHLLLDGGDMRQLLLETFIHNFFGCGGRERQKQDLDHLTAFGHCIALLVKHFVTHRSKQYKNRLFTGD